MTDIGSLEHRYLRSAIEFAIAIAAGGQKMRPPIAYPPALKPFLKQARVPSGALGSLRRKSGSASIARRSDPSAPLGTLACLRNGFSAGG